MLLSNQTRGDKFTKVHLQGLMRHITVDHSRYEDFSHLSQAKK